MKLQFEKLRKNQKGGAFVAIAILMAMSLAVLFVQNIVWERFLTNEEINRMREQVDITSVSINNGIINFDLKNVGEVPVHVVSLWVNNTRYDMDNYLNIEEIETNIGNNLVLDTPPNANSSQVISIYTERGSSDTIFYIPEEEAGNPTWDVGVTGVFKVDWFYSKYSSNGTNGLIFDAIKIGKNDTYVAFYMNITNQWNHNCTILPSSFVTLTSLSTIGAHEEPNFFIVKELDYLTDPEFPKISEAYLDGELHSIVNEGFNSGTLNTTVLLTYQNISSSPAPIVTNMAENVTYEEGIDYIIDYAEGGITCIIGGNMQENTDYLIDYEFRATDPYIVKPQESIILIFAAHYTWDEWKYDGAGDDWRWGSRCPTYESGIDGAGIQISLFYYSLEHPEAVYGQTISTQALILLEG